MNKTATKSKPAAPGKSTRPLAARFPIVGIGASAGGLEAVTSLLKHLPADTGMAFVVVQHLKIKLRLPIEQNFPVVGHRSLLLNARRLASDPAQPPSILLAMEDVTHQPDPP